MFIRGTRDERDHSRDEKWKAGAAQGQYTQGIWIERDL